MLSYHGLYRIGKKESQLLFDFSMHYQHVYRYVYATWAKQQALIFSKEKQLTNKELICNFYDKNNKDTYQKIPKFNFTLTPEHKKQILKNKLITGRQLNTMLFQLKGNLSSIYELKLNELNHKKTIIQKLNKEIERYKRKINNSIKILNYNKEQKDKLNKAFKLYKLFKYNTKSKNKNKNKNKKFTINYEEKDISIHLIKDKFKLYNLINKKHNINNSLNKLIIQLLIGKLPLCFGTKKLFHKQFNLKHYYKDYNNLNNNKFFKLWKNEWKENRNNSFYLMGCKSETAGNQSCIAKKQDNGLISLRIRLPDYIVIKNNPNIKPGSRVPDNYVILNDLDFGYAHETLLEALEDKLPIHYRFERNINKQSPKYGLWAITFQVDTKETPIVTNINLGAIGIDVNQEHISVAEINRHGNLVKAYDIPLQLSYVNKDYHSNKHMRNHNKITDLTSHQSSYLIENIVHEICLYAKQVGKSIVIEKLDFDYKKKSLQIENKLGLNYQPYRKQRNKQLSSFAYGKIKEAFLSKTRKEGIQLIEVNPAYTSLLGLVKYQKNKGISTHQAAAYVIARKGMGCKEQIPSVYKEISNKVDNKATNKNLIYFIFNGKVIDSVLPVRNVHESSYNNFILLKTLSTNVRESKKRYIEQLKKKVLAQANNKGLNPQISSSLSCTLTSINTVGSLPELDIINPNNLG